MCNDYSFAIEGHQDDAAWFDFQVFYGNIGLNQTPETPILGAVSGSGHITWPEGTPGEGIWRTFTLSARKFSDGSVAGHMQLNNHGSTSVWKGIVDCLIVNDNQAFVAGTMIMRGSEHLSELFTFAGQVIDGSSSGAKDQITFIFQIRELYTDICNGNSFEGAPLMDVESGNVTVRDNS